MHNRISGVVITYNEERNIERCILSLKSICDEVIVVDSFSSDGTAEICQRQGVRFIQHAFEGFGAQKQWATSQAMYDYVLSLDADECFSPELIQELKIVKSGNMSDCYEFPRLTMYCGHWVRHCGWYPDRKIRLWNKDKASWSGLTVHETVIPKRDSALLVTLQNPILHYSFERAEDHYRKIEHYATLQSEALYQKGKKFSPAYKYFASIIKFLEVCFFKLGFMDGRTGFQIARRSAEQQFLKYQKLEILNRNSKH
ncbi:MAG: glycosyltransferase family 2 protein [Saprospiraceae bacterium]|nr:glycosyltransferase family 2 protein [Saprospiraceae bacterium]HMW38679.1 glycosyltransferase family 2 protein [Saprospiraceae bacterium]HMX88189.1 glycosyltransferase family 2 protein [Saprospiraceae bacterium]HMZ39927.1 glycosyltransferase family 2 protein [Saprospiraceae bacterium]HNA63883.1 glycosyltransferase family 2 protein [Saprospiraceae bacterium]